MKTRKQFRGQAERIRAAFEQATKRNQLPLLEVRLKRSGKGVQLQTIGIDRQGALIYCGVHHVPELSARWVYRLHRQWERWRRWYDNLPYNRAQDYPAKHCPPVAWTGAYAVGNSNAVLWVGLPAGPAHQAPWRDGEAPASWPAKPAPDLAPNAGSCAGSVAAPDLSL